MPWKRSSTFGPYSLVCCLFFPFLASGTISENLIGPRSLVLVPPALPQITYVNNSLIRRNETVHVNDILVDYGQEKDYSGSTEEYSEEQIVDVLSRAGSVPANALNFDFQNMKQEPEVRLFRSRRSQETDLTAAATGYGHGQSKGGGASHYSKYGHQGKQGHHSQNGYKKGHQGHENNAHKKGKYGSNSGNSKAHKQGGQHYGGKHHGAKGSKHQKYGKKGGHRKGHSTKGFHNTYHKDEYSKQKKFYDDYHTGGHHSKHGEHGQHHNEHGGKKHHGQHHNRHHDDNHHSKYGHHSQGHYDDQHKGHNANHGQKGHHGYHSSHGKKGQSHYQEPSHGGGGYGHGGGGGGGYGGGGGGGGYGGGGY